jgi:tetratricopeptide (TPR) repeat protein
MRGAELYERVINLPGRQDLAIAFGVSVALIMLAALLLSLGRLRVFARVLGVLGVVAIMVTLFVIHEQTDKHKDGQFVTVTRYRYPESTRFQIRIALIGLPAAAAMMMIWVLGSTRRRLRSTVPDHLKEARKLLAQGSHDAALTELNMALKISPHLGEAYFLRGSVHEAQSRVDEALADFDRALQADPQHARAHLHRGRIHTEKGDFDSAMFDFDQVMIMRPNDAECYLNRGVCQAKRGQIGEAIIDFQRVLKLTNHSDFAEPARHYLQQLGGENPLSPHLPAPSSNGSAQAPAPANEPPTTTDYVF